MKNKVEPTIQDGMPREVAVAMLTEPKAKLTNRMRKNCKQALVEVFPSKSQIVGGCYSGVTAKLPEVRLAQRCKRATWTQLNTWLARMEARRMSVQTKYQEQVQQLENLKGVTDLTPAQVRKGKKLAFEIVALASVAQNLDLVWGALEDEINARKARTAHNTVIDPAKIRLNNLLRAVRGAHD